MTIRRPVAWASPNHEGIPELLKPDHDLISKLIDHQVKSLNLDNQRLWDSALFQRENVVADQYGFKNYPREKALQIFEYLTPIFKSLYQDDLLWRFYDELEINRKENGEVVDKMIEYLKLLKEIRGKSPKRWREEELEYRYRPDYIRAVQISWDQISSPGFLVKTPAKIRFDHPRFDQKP